MASYSLADLRRETEIERWALQTARERYRTIAQAAVEAGRGATLRAGRRLLGVWFEGCRDAIEAEKAACGCDRRHGKAYRKYLREIDSESLASIAMHRVLGECLRNPGGIKLTGLASSVGREAVAEAQYAALLRDGRGRPEHLEALARRHGGTIQPWMLERVFKESSPDIRSTAVFHLGVVLVDILVKVATVETAQGTAPARGA